MMRRRKARESRWLKSMENLNAIGIISPEEEGFFEKAKRQKKQLGGERRSAAMSYVYLKESDFVGIYVKWCDASAGILHRVIKLRNLPISLVAQIPSL